MRVSYNKACQRTSKPPLRFGFAAAAFKR